MKTLGILAATGVLFAASAASALPTINFAGGSSTTAPATVFQDFEGFADGASLGTNASVYANAAGDAARPAFGSSGNFGAVRADGSYNVIFGASKVFSFVLGSLDTYNTLELFFTDGTSKVYKGGDIIDQGSFPSGNQGATQTNGVVSYTAVGNQYIKGATFGSIGSNSFEFDNLARTAVPEPATWGMMILGFGAVGSAMRRRRRTTVSFA